MPRRPHHFFVPVSVTAETTGLWTTLLNRAETFRDLAPWTYLDGSSLFGVRDSDAGAIDWCSVMGQNDEVSGVAIYSGEVGVASLLDILSDGTDELDSKLQQAAQVLTFHDRADISRDMVAVLKAIGKRYRGSLTWPELLTHEPGYYPMPPRDEPTLRRLISTLEGLCAMCAQARMQPGWDSADASGAHWLMTIDGPGSGSLSREHLPQPAKPAMPTVVIDEVAVARIEKKGRERSGPILIDWFAGDGVIDGPEAQGRPYYVMHRLIINTHGLVAAAELSPYGTIWPDMARMVLAYCETHGVPQLLIVRRAEAVPVLGPLAARVGCGIVCRPDTAQVIHHIRDSLSAALGR